MNYASFYIEGSPPETLPHTTPPIGKMLDHRDLLQKGEWGSRKGGNPLGGNAWKTTGKPATETAIPLYILYLFK